MKKIISLILFTVTIFILSCKSQSKELVFYYVINNEHKIIFFQKRIYAIDKFDIIENVYTLDTYGKLIEHNKNHFKKNKDGLDIIINKIENEYLKITKPNKCVSFYHPMMYDVENCFNGYKKYKSYDKCINFTYSQKVIDGITREYYLDENYCLIDEKDLTGNSLYNEIIRIDIFELPKNIKDKIVSID